MNGSVMLEQFFLVEGDERLVEILTEAVDSAEAPTRSYFTFNVFNVWIDLGLGIVRIQDDLPPGEEYEVTIVEFRQRLDEERCRLRADIAERPFAEDE
jgi:hypothetical protein